MSGSSRDNVFSISLSSSESFSKAWYSSISLLLLPCKSGLVDWFVQLWIVILSADTFDIQHFVSIVMRIKVQPNSNLLGHRQQFRCSFTSRHIINARTLSPFVRLWKTQRWFQNNTINDCILIWKITKRHLPLDWVAPAFCLSISKFVYEVFPTNVVWLFSTFIGVTFCDLR